MAQTKRKTASSSNKISKVGSTKSSSNDTQRRKSNRVHQQTKLYQAPKSIKSQTTRKSKKKIEKKSRNNRKDIDVKTKTKVNSKKETKTKSKNKKDILMERTGIKQYEENPFFADSKVPEAVSTATYYRWLIRACKRNDIKEIENYFKSNRVVRNGNNLNFSYTCKTNAITEACKMKNMNHIKRFFELSSKHRNNNEENFIEEPNLLKKKINNTGNQYMLGFKTKPVEMSRGGREANNALINYSPSHDMDVLETLIEENMPYIKIYKLAKDPNTPFNESYLESKVVDALRMGHCEIASSIAEGPAKRYTNELLRITLKEEKFTKKLLAASVMSKSQFLKQITPIHAAAIKKDSKMLEEMKNVCPNINIPDREDWYTIHYAAASETPENLKFCFKNRLSASLLTKKKDSLLHVAAMAGRHKNIPIILKEMLDVEKQGTDEIVAKNSLVNAHNASGMTALHLAVTYDRIETVKALLEEKTVLVDAPWNRTKFTPLMIACGWGNIKMVKLLLEHGANPQELDSKKRTPLIHAVMNGQTHIAALLLKMGVDETRADSSGNGPIHYATAYGFLDCIKILISVNAELLKSQNDWMMTALSIAYLRGHYGIVDWFLSDENKKIVDINCQDSEGNTILMSVLKYQTDFVYLYSQMEFLLSRGVNSGLKDSHGYTALHIYASLNIDCPEFYVCEPTRKDSYYYKCYDSLLKAGAMVYDMDTQGKTPIHCALTNGNLQLFEWMLEDYAKCGYSVEKSAEIFGRGLHKENILHYLLEYPMKIVQRYSYWEKPGLLGLQDFDMMQALNLFEKVFDKGLILKWLEECNRKGMVPVQHAINEYSKSMNEIIRHGVAYDKEQMKQLNDTIMWAIKLSGNMFSQYQDPTDISRKTNLPMMALKLHSNLIDTDSHLFVKMIEYAKSIKQERNIEKLKGNNNEHVIVLAARNDFKKAVNVLLTFCDDLELIREKEIIEDNRVFERSLAMVLIEKQMYDIVSKLNKKCFHFRDTDGCNMYHYAARVKGIEAVDLFELAYEADVEFVANEQGQTPFHEAVKSSDRSSNTILEPIIWMKNKFPDKIGFKDLNKRSAEHYLFYTNQEIDGTGWNEDPLSVIDPISILTIIATNISEPNGDINGNNLVHLAVRRNSMVCLTYLLQNNARLNDTNKDGNTPLALAFNFGRKEMALALIQAKATPFFDVYPEQNNVNKLVQEKLERWVLKSSDEKKECRTFAETILSHGDNWIPLVYIIIKMAESENQNSTDINESKRKCVFAALKNSMCNFARTLVNSSLTAEDVYKIIPVFAENNKNELIRYKRSNDFLDSLERYQQKGGGSTEHFYSLLFLYGLKFGNWNLCYYVKEKYSEINYYKGEKPLKYLLAYMAKNETDEKAVKFLREIPSADGVDFTPMGDVASQGKVKLIRVLKMFEFPVDDYLPMMLVNAIKSQNVKAVRTLLHHVPRLADEGKQKKKKLKMMRLFFGTGRKRRVGGNLYNITEVSDIDEIDEDMETRNIENECDSDDVGDEDEEVEEPPIKRFAGMRRTQNQPKTDIKEEDRENFRRACADTKDNNVLSAVVNLKTDNVEMLKCLLKYDQSIIIKMADSDIIKNASKTMQRGILKEIRELSSKFDIQIPEMPRISIDSIYLKKFEEYDLEEIYAKCLKWKEAQGERTQTTSEEDRRPAKDSTYRDTGKIVFCEETQQLFDVVLNKTQLSYGKYGFHNFYKMQLIKQNYADLWILFTNWGRIGDISGDVQITPFSTFEAAKKEFASIWKSKTGNVWSNLSNFEEKKGKYRLFRIGKNAKNHKLNVSMKSHRTSFNGTFDDMLYDVTRPDMLQKYFNETNKYSRNHDSPLGEIPIENIEKAHKTLDECEDYVRKLNNLLEKNVLNEEEILKIHEKFDELSSQYYMLIATGEYELSRIECISSQQSIDSARAKLNRLTEVSVSIKVMSSIEYLVEVEKRTFIDCMHGLLKCQFNECSPNDEISKMILKWIRNSSDNVEKIVNIFDIKPQNSITQFEPFADDFNQMYLFHGTNALNLISILYSGFLIDPPSTIQNGRMLGAGVYLADCFAKSSNYCRESASGVKYMFICQVALGEMRRTSTYWNQNEEGMGHKEDTAYCIGNKVPSTNELINGVKIPNGKVVDRDSKGYSLSYSEYVVRNPHRILPRYIVAFK